MENKNITIGDVQVKELLERQENPLELQDKLRALFSYEEKKDDPFPINARELHDFLGVQAHYKDWMPRMTAAISAEENEDFSSKLSESTGGRPSKEYYLSVTTCKEIAAIQRTDLGKLVRRYLIWAEKQLQSQQQKPLSALEILELQVQAMKDIQKRQQEQQAQISA